MKEFEEYLREAAARGIIDHALRVQVGANGTVAFYVHPVGADGDTLDFRAQGNTLEALR